MSEVLKRGLRVSPDQQEIMVEFLEKHKNFKEGKLTNDFTRAQYDALWEVLMLKLNSCGSGAQKDVDKWKSTLSDWKTAVKKKAANLKRPKTGGGPPPKPLTVLESKLLEVIGKIVVAGDKFINEAGFDNETQNSNYATVSKPMSHSLSDDQSCRVEITPDTNIEQLEFSDNFGKTYDVYRSLSPKPGTSKTSDFNEATFMDGGDEVNQDAFGQDVNVSEKPKKKYQTQGKKMSAARLAPYDAAAKELKEIQSSTDEILRGIQRALECNAKALEKISEAEHRKAKAEEIKAEASKNLVDYKLKKLEITRQGVKAQLQFSSALTNMVQVLNERREC